MGTTSDRPPGPRPPGKTCRDGAEHYSWGEGCDGWHFVRAPGLSVILEQMPAGASEVEHHHQVARQYFHMLEGETVMDLEGREIALAAGDGIEIAPGLRHRILNRSAGPARFLVVSQPPSHGDRIVSPQAGRP